MARKRRRKTRSAGFTKQERLLISLHEVAKETDDSEIRTTAFSLIQWYQRNGEWTYPQQRYAQRLINGHKGTATLRVEKPKPSYCLYAVRLGNSLKVGFSSDVDARIKSYRTGTSDVELMAVIPLGECSMEKARNCERKLHKTLTEYRIEREIFRLDALRAVKAWAA